MLTFLYPNFLRTCPATGEKQKYPIPTEWRQKGKRISTGSIRLLPRSFHGRLTVGDLQTRRLQLRDVEDVLEVLVSGFGGQEDEIRYKGDKEDGESRDEQNVEKTAGTRNRRSAGSTRKAWLERE
jgi:hypothetical protein